MAENKRQNEVIEMSAAEIRAFALRVKYLAAQIETVAESLEKMSEKRLKVTGFATADRGAGYLRTFVGTIRSALDDLALLVPEQLGNANAVKISEEINEKDAKRKGRK